MRPVRLELEGFTAFREPTVVDFAGAELFALVGPTGAGKSSIVDAVCFALYGSVPRLDRRTVDPVISSGRVQARVRLDFTVGTTPYTAVRVVRRLPRGGASTKEARLEAGPAGVGAGGGTDLLAGDADAVTAAVTGLLGLGFEQFTKCVVLPQGDFARFLHDKPRDRQDLLVRLLELGVYDRMRERAGQRRVLAEAARDGAARQLAGLSDATPDAVAMADERVRRLAALRDRLEAAHPRVEALLAQEREARSAAGAAAQAVALLEGVAVPAGLDALSARVDAARADAAGAEAAVAAAELRVDDARGARSALPDRSPLEEAHRLAAELEQARGRRAKGRPILDATRRAEADGAARLAEAADRALTAAAALDGARREHAAHAVAAHLVAGEPCPVCTQPVARLPDRAPPAALTAAEEAVANATVARTTAERAQPDLVAARARAEETMRGVEVVVAEREAALAGAPAAADVAALLGRITAAERAVEEAETAARTARAAARDAAGAVTALRTSSDAARREVAAARDRVAAYGPPAVEGADLAADWRVLVTWARGEATARRVTATDGEARAAALRREAAAQEAELVAACTAEQVAVEDRRPRDACADALAEQSARHRRLAEDLERAAALRQEADGEGERAAVAQTLGRHLGAAGFERWLLDEALHALVDGASHTLRELSGGQYSLDVDPQRAFAVIDHREADDRRSARTLSGGETFLASLALALSLADRLVDMSVGSAPRLESVFLDEGFGTLDPGTLDTVAAALEELGARGRTVGVVTHVRDLAERMPVRFEVRKTAAGAAVQRVDR